MLAQVTSEHLGPRSVHARLRTRSERLVEELNDRPRERLAFANPTEQLAELVLQ
jgi:hypothetical protein